MTKLSRHTAHRCIGLSQPMFKTWNDNTRQNGFKSHKWAPVKNTKSQQVAAATPPGQNNSSSSTYQRLLRAWRCRWPRPCPASCHPSSISRSSWLHTIRGMSECTEQNSNWNPNLQGKTCMNLFSHHVLTPLQHQLHAYVNTNTMDHFAIMEQVLTYAHIICSYTCTTSKFHVKIDILYSNRPYEHLDSKFSVFLP